jgi:hypothetical protein
VGVDKAIRVSPADNGAADKRRGEIISVTEAR